MGSGQGEKERVREGAWEGGKIQIALLLESPCDKSAIKS